MEELKALVSRLKAIVTEMEAVMDSQPKKKLSKDEYLAMDEDKRAKHDMEQMEPEEENDV